MEVKNFKGLAVDRIPAPQRCCLPHSPKLCILLPYMAKGTSQICLNEERDLDYLGGPSIITRVLLRRRQAVRSQR